MNIFFDIETIPSQVPWVRDELAASITHPGTLKKPESIAEWVRESKPAAVEDAYLKTSFDGGLGQIVCIGWCTDEGEPVSRTAADLSVTAERDMLEGWFLDLIDAFHAGGKRRPVFVGHNHVAFDIPFVWKRCMVLGVKPPLWFPRAPKPWSEAVADTMLLWDASQRAGGSMDRLCRILGIPGKGDGPTGADVWPMVQAGRLDEVAAYCRADVERTRAMYRRMTFQPAITELETA